MVSYFPFHSLSLIMNASHPDTQMTRQPDEPTLISRSDTLYKFHELKSIVPTPPDILPYTWVIETLFPDVFHTMTCVVVVDTIINNSSLEYLVRNIIDDTFYCSGLMVSEGLMYEERTTCY